MDELRGRLGAAIAHLEAALPRPEEWNDQAAIALTTAVHELAADIGTLLIDCVGFLQPLQPFLGSDG
jgi:hypothetical protein